MHEHSWEWAVLEPQNLSPIAPYFHDSTASTKKPSRFPPHMQEARLFHFSFGCLWEPQNYIVVGHDSHRIKQLRNHFVESGLHEERRAGVDASYTCLAIGHSLFDGGEWKPIEQKS